MSKELAVVVLTFNSARIIERTILAARQVAGSIICVDSHSTDATTDMLRRLGCEVYARPFKNYADQRNWAIETVGDRYLWQLHLDADEILDARAISSIRSAIMDPQGYMGFLLHRRTYFLGRQLRHGGASSWHLRLFQTGICEDRLYDQHFLCTGPIRKLEGSLHDTNAGTLTEWTARHNRWSELEATELLRPEYACDRGHSKLRARFGGDPRERRRAYKSVYYRAPRFLRAWLYFIFRYVVQLGFLDGRAGFLYAFLQALWFRMLVDAKLQEACSNQQHHLEELARDGGST